ncbi:unnamed protein product [marine sediment metagenome]|uniref:Ada DNA repair metal-binding domain-containing protein n=1 Tax=marine sediment metagenome TaxID=412755 RepID=X0UBW2_9ZZZZ
MPEETRPYLVNITRKTVHSTASEIPFCQPDPADNIGYADEGRLESLALEQGFTPCAYCLRDEGDAILAEM